MRSFLASAFMVFAVSAGGAQASEAAGRISVQSREGQAIVKEVVGISRRLGLPNPFAAPEPEPVLSLNERRGAIFRPYLTLREQALRHEGLDGRADTLQGRTGLAAGVKEQLRAERAALLSRLDLDAETQARIIQN